MQAEEVWESPTDSSANGAGLEQEPQGSIQKLEEAWSGFFPRLPGGSAAVLDFSLLASRILRW